jgi:hypothetical protein
MSEEIKMYKDSIYVKICKIYDKYQVNYNLLFLI